MGRDGAGAEGSRRDLQEMKTGRYETLERSAATIEERKDGDPEKSYVAKLFTSGDEAMLKKIAEQPTELGLAARSGERLQIVRETADLGVASLTGRARH